MTSKAVGMQLTPRVSCGLQVRTLDKSEDASSAVHVLCSPDIVQP